MRRLILRPVTQIYFACFRDERLDTTAVTDYTCGFTVWQQRDKIYHDIKSLIDNDWAGPSALIYMYNEMICMSDDFCLIVLIYLGLVGNRTQPRRVCKLSAGWLLLLLLLWPPKFDPKFVFTSHDTIRGVGTVFMNTNSMAPL